MTRLTFALLMVGICFSGAAAQEIVQIGGPGAIGCQDPMAPVLSNGDVATATYIYDYDPNMGVLTLTVDNTTPVIPGANTAVLTEIFLSMPPSVSGVMLLTQTAGSGTTDPNFSLQYGANTVACLGTFDVAMFSPPPTGIANPMATNLVGPPGSQALGPATFELGIAAINPAALTSADFAQALTPDTALAAGAKFQGSGAGGGPGSGFLGSSPCLGITAISQSLGYGCGNWMGMDPVLTIDPPALGTTMDIVLDSEFPGALYWLVASVGQPTPTCVNMLGQIVPCTDPSAICTIHIDLNDLNNIIPISIGLTDANGDYMLSLPIPQSATPLIGLEFTLQARLCAPNAPIQGPFQDWFSNAVFIRFGCP